MTKLFIDGVLIDLEPSEPIACTYQRNDIAELKDRQADFTNEFKVPLTNHNKITFGNPDMVATDSIKAYRLHNAKLEQDGIEIIQNGIAIINESDENGYVNITVLSGIYDFFQTISNKSIKDLAKLSLSNHKWTSQNAFNSTVDNQAGFLDYTYPLIQYGGEDALNQDFNIARQVPSFFIRKIVDYIFEEAGYTKEGMIFNYDFYNRLLLPLTDGAVRSQEWIKARSAKVGTSNFITSVPTSLAGISYTSGDILFEFGENNLIEGKGVDASWIFMFGNDNSTFGVFPNNNYWVGSNDRMSQSEYIADDAYRIDVVLSIDYDIDLTFLTSATLQFKFTILKNGVEIANQQSAIYSSVNFYENQNVTVNAGNIDMQQGDVITFKWEVKKVGNSGVFNTIIKKGTSFASITPQSIILVNSTLDIADMMPEISQVDFLKSIFQMFAISTQSDNSIKTLRCKTFKEIASTVPLDWSYKLDLSKKITINYRIGDYAINNLFNYKDDNIRGNGTLVIDDNTLDFEKVIIELPYAASDDNAQITSDKINVVSIPFFIGEAKQNITPRIIALRRGENKRTSITLYDGVTTNYTRTNGFYPSAYFIDTLQGGHLGFQGYLLPEYYAELGKVLNKCKAVKCYLNLTPIDIQDLDFFRPIYINYFGVNFYVNKIEDYMPNDSTLCELIRL